mmetsp:Transcript_13220/g.20597  ORF Transcript_13220/g.20597 Transcript_13220/m.20597 type:complete len:286 (-) Transcript_13220:923-1780(-)
MVLNYPNLLGTRPVIDGGFIKLLAPVQCFHVNVMLFNTRNPGAGLVPKVEDHRRFPLREERLELRRLGVLGQPRDERAGGPPQLLQAGLGPGHGVTARAVRGRLAHPKEGLLRCFNGQNSPGVENCSIQATGVNLHRGCLDLVRSVHSQAFHSGCCPGILFHHGVPESFVGNLHVTSKWSPKLIGLRVVLDKNELGTAAAGPVPQPLGRRQRRGLLLPVGPRPLPHQDLLPGVQDEHVVEVEGGGGPRHLGHAGASLALDHQQPRRVGRAVHVREPGGHAPFTVA